MDKYTVDLDKVLNDFEYSELTDQYVRQSNASQSHSFSSSRNRGVKHSITNVFHSLNEYLNTEVADKCDVVTEIVAQTNDAYESPFSVPTDEPVKEIPLIQNLKLEDNNVASTSLGVGEGDQKTAENTEIAPESTENRSEIVEVRSESPASSLPVVDNNLVIIDDVIENTFSNNLSEPAADERTTESTEIVADKHVIEEENHEQQIVENAKTIDNQSVEKLPIESLLSEDNSSIPVGFDDTFEVDESELNKYLDELENELDIQEDTEDNVKTLETLEKRDENEEIRSEERLEIGGSSNEEQVKEITENERKDIEEEPEIAPNLPRPVSLELPKEVENKRNINLIGKYTFLKSICTGCLMIEC